MSPASDAVDTTTERDGPKAFELRGVAQAFWRHKLITIVGVLLTVIVTGALVVTAKPTYEAKDTILLKGPSEEAPADPSEPAFKNPFLQYGGSLEVLSNSLKNVMDNKATALTLEEEGLDGKFKIVIDPTGSGAIMDLVVESDTQAKALAGGDLLLEQLEGALADDLQGPYPDSVKVTVDPLTQPDEAAPLYASRMRVGMMALALGLLLTATATAIAESRRRRRASGGAGAPAEPIDRAPSGGTGTPLAPGQAPAVTGSTGRAELPAPPGEVEPPAAAPELEPARASDTNGNGNSNGASWPPAMPKSPAPPKAAGAGKGTGVRKRPRVRAAATNGNGVNGNGNGVNGNGSQSATADPAADPR